MTWSNKNLNRTHTHEHTHTHTNTHTQTHTHTHTHTHTYTQEKLVKYWLKQHDMVKQELRSLLEIANSASQAKSIGVEVLQVCCSVLPCVTVRCSAK